MTTRNRFADIDESQCEMDAVAMTDALTESASTTLGAVLARLIPTDEHGPGAREACVARYIEQALLSDYHALQSDYEDGLRGIDEYASRTFGVSFAQLALKQQDELLVAIEHGDGGLSSLARFFKLLLAHAMEGMFGDPAYGGNAGQVGWKLVGYPGPRYSWSAGEQSLEEIAQERGDRSASAPPAVHEERSPRSAS